MTLLATILEAAALVILQHAMLAAVVAGAEAAVANDALGLLLAVLEAAADLLGWHAASHGQEEVQRAVGEDVGGFEGLGFRGGWW